MKSLFRKLYRVGVALEWVLLGCLALEALEAGRLVLAERMYQAFFDAQTRKVYRMAPAEDAVQPLPVFRGALSPAASAAPSMPLDADKERNLRATLHGELVLFFGRDGAYLGSYGEPLLEQYLRSFLRDGHLPGDWAVVAQAIRTAQQPEYFEMTCMIGGPHFYQVAVIPTQTPLRKAAPVTVRARDITRSKALELQHFGEAPGEDSPWEVLCFRYKKNWRRPGDLLETNNYGFRDEDVVVPKPAGVYRIVCIGGSTTEEGNTTENSYPNILERKLRDMLGTNRIDVVNCGICGLTTCGARERIDDYLALEPDLLLFYGGVNDLCHLDFEFWLDAARPWQKLLRRSFFLTRWFNRQVLPPEPELAAFIEQTTFRNLAAIQYAARQRGVALAVCSLAYPEVPWWAFRTRSYYDRNLAAVWHSQGVIYFDTYCALVDQYNRLLEAFCARKNIPYVPVAEAMHGGADHFFDICHVTALGIERKAEIIADFVQGAILEPAGPGHSSPDTDPIPRKASS